MEASDGDGIGAMASRIVFEWLLSKATCWDVKHCMQRVCWTCHWRNRRRYGRVDEDIKLRLPPWTEILERCGFDDRFGGDQERRNRPTFQFKSNAAMI
jgi:hypothetical protein|tara:strand:+ start:500 stop:793 length:294 start_codon:yes stop_codon:yes gene_type:complete